MIRPLVRCRCGHQVLSKEVLRTDLYERASGRDYIYVKYRCRRCKRLGEEFVPENCWDWNIFEPLRNEMSDPERQKFDDRAPISVGDVLAIHSALREPGVLSDCVTGLAPAPVTQNPPRTKPNDGTAERGAARTGGEPVAKPPRDARQAEHFRGRAKGDDGTRPHTKGSSEPGGSDIPCS